MSSASLPDNERERLLALYECDVLDTPSDPLFDSITTLAAQVCAAPIALLSLIDQRRQWFKSNHGLPGVAQTPREVAFCAHAILGEEMLEISDATRDARFFDLLLLDHVAERGVRAIDERSLPFDSHGLRCTRNV